MTLDNLVFSAIALALIAGWALGILTSHFLKRKKDKYPEGLYLHASYQRPAPEKAKLTKPPKKP